MFSSQNVNAKTINILVPGQKNKKIKIKFKNTKIKYSKKNYKKGNKLKRSHKKWF